MILPKTLRLLEKTKATVLTGKIQNREGGFLLGGFRFSCSHVFLFFVFRTAKIHP
jgi:hypothetical protein